MTGAAGLFALAGRTAVVTGGSRGIGLAIAEGLAAAGAAVVVVNSRGEQGRQAAAALQAKGLAATAIQADVSKRAAVERLVGETLARHGAIDVLVNAAAVIVRKPIEEVTDDDWDALMDVNLRGLFLCCQLVGREMIRQGGGKIINIASNIVQPLQPNRGLYAVTKAGVARTCRTASAPYRWAAWGIPATTSAWPSCWHLRPPISSRDRPSSWTAAAISSEHPGGRRPARMEVMGPREMA
jgi:NAD(P)-dependent dehydrogenase (short-subunit alcohol dehydrogenase family)